MIIKHPNQFIEKEKSGLASIEVHSNNHICITLKNGATLTVKPCLHKDENEETVLSYEYIYLTGKENRKIARMKDKIDGLKSEIENLHSLIDLIKENPLDEKSEKTSTNKEGEDEDEKVEENNEELPIEEEMDE